MTVHAKSAETRPEIGNPVILARPETADFLSLDAVIASVASVGSGPPGWIEGITARYAGI